MCRKPLVILWTVKKALNNLKKSSTGLQRRRERRGRSHLLCQFTSHSHMANKNVIHRYKLLQTAVQSFSADELNEF